MCVVNMFMEPWGSKAKSFSIKWRNPEEIQLNQIMDNMKVHLIWSKKKVMEALESINAPSVLSHNKLCNVEKICQEPYFLNYEISISQLIKNIYVRGERDHMHTQNVLLEL